MTAAGASLLSADRPFPGLRPFDYPDHPFFFGRVTQVHALYRMCDRSRFIAVIGSSGSGKSSLVRAGLRPFLDRENSEAGGRTWSWVEMRPGDAPLARLTDALTDLAAASGDDPATRAALRARVAYDLQHSSFGIAEALGRIDGLGGKSILLVVDQFEELFRFSSAAARPAADAPDELRLRDEAAQFVQLLLEAARSPDRDVRVLLTMRSDFIGDCARFHGLPEAVSATQFLVPSLTRDQIEEVIRKPIERAGARIEPELVERLLNDCSDEPDQLPVLQHCLARLWECARQDGPPAERVLTAEHYRQVGRISGSLSQHADEIMGSLPGAERTVEQVFRALSELDKEGRATRRAVPFAQLVAETGESEADLRRVLDRFRADDCSFLVPSVSQVPSLAPDTRIDVGHEALLRRWMRVSRDIEATLAGSDDPFAVGWLRAEERDGHTYRSLLTFIEAARHRTPTLNRQQFEENWDWWRARPRTEAWARRYGGGHERVQRLFADSRAALRRERTRTYAAVGVGLLLVGTLGASGYLHWVTEARNERMRLDTLRAEEERDVQARLAQQRLDDTLRMQGRLADQIIKSMRDGTILARGAQDLLDTVVRAAALQPGGGSAKPTVLDVDLKMAASDVASAIGEWTEALALARQSYSIAADSLTNEPDSIPWQLLLYRSASRAADILSDQWERKEAEELYGEARRIALRLREKQPENVARPLEVSIIEDKLGALHMKWNEYPAAIERYRTAFNAIEPISQQRPRDAGLRHQLANIRIHLGRAYGKLNERAKAAAEFDQAMAIGRELVDRDPHNDVWRSIVITTHAEMGDFYGDLKDPENALVHYRKARELIADPNTRDAERVQWREQLAFLHIKIGQLMRSRGEYTDARAEFEQALAVRRSLANKDPTYLVRQTRLAAAHMLLGDLLAQQQMLEPALGEFMKSLEIRRKLYDARPYIYWARRALSDNHEKIGDLLNGVGIDGGQPRDRKAALEHYRLALQAEPTADHEVPNEEELKKWTGRLERLRKKVADLSREAASR
jgi:tetratricopeptide (TPR) repeat protein